MQQDQDGIYILIIIFVPFLPLLCLFLSWAKHTILHPILCTELRCASGKFMEMCCGLLDSTLWKCVIRIYRLVGQHLLSLSSGLVARVTVTVQ